MRHVTFYDLQTGLLNGTSLLVSDDKAIALNVPAGHAAIDHPSDNAPQWDHLSQRVDIETGKVVDYQPPQPSPDHQWNGTSKRWVLSAAAVAKQQARQATQEHISSLEAQSPALVRAAVLSGDHAALNALDSQIRTLRASLES